MNRIIIFLAIILWGSTAHAQQDSIPESQPVGRKKVAVVLSGGGAKGMAHIGVLKVLERAGIPIDIITGTSMGSIIGGLYSIGYNANTIDSLVRKMDWTFLLTDKDDLSNQSLEDREKQNTYILSVNTSNKGDVNAGGIIKGQNLFALFQRLCTGYIDSLDFSRDLPIPFACVATNIMDNSEVVFHSGYLPKAMRASMAIPAAFSPVRIDDMVLVDGGLRNNYPVDVARDMGADLVIGVTLHGKAKKSEDVSGTFSVLSQIIDVNCYNKHDENVASTDLYMNVDPQGYSTVSFSEKAIDSLVFYGEQEAMRHWDDILALKKRIGLPPDYQPTIHHPVSPHVLSERKRVTGVSFENMTPIAKRFLIQKFDLDKIDSIDVKLEQAITTTMRVDLFYNTAECRRIPDGDGVRVVIKAGERKSIQLRGGIRFDTEEYVAMKLGLEIPLRTAIPMNTDISVRLGKRIIARAAITAHPRSFTQPILSYTFYRNDIDVYINGERDYTVLFNQGRASFIPLNFNWRNFNIRIGLHWDYMHYRNQLSNASLRDVNLKDEHYFNYNAQVNYNSEDDWYFPTRGARFKAGYAFLTDNLFEIKGATGMSELHANWRMSFTIGNRFTIQPMVYGRMLFGSVIPTVYDNVIGGNWFGHYVEQQMPFAGIGNVEHVDRQFVAAQLQAQQRIGESFYALLRVSAAQQANDVEELLDYKTLVGGQLGFYYNSMFGPVGATLGYSNRTKKGYFLLNLGYTF